MNLGWGLAKGSMSLSNLSVQTRAAPQEGGNLRRGAAGI